MLQPKQTRTRTRPHFIGLRLTTEELARLKTMCAGGKYSAFIRQRIFLAPQASPENIAQSGKVAAHA